MSRDLFDICGDERTSISEHLIIGQVFDKNTYLEIRRVIFLLSVVIIRSVRLIKVTSMATEGSIVLIYYQEKPSVFARIEAIEPDIKKNWYQVTLLLLTIPTQTVTWILRDSYIQGEPFTMGGQGVRLEYVKRVLREKSPAASNAKEGKKIQGKTGRVLPFKRPDRRNS